MLRRFTQYRIYHLISLFFFFNDTATTEIYTLSLHDALPISKGCRTVNGGGMAVFQAVGAFRLFTGIEPDAERMMRHFLSMRSEEHTSELQSRSDLLLRLVL